MSQRIFDLIYSTVTFDLANEQLPHRANSLLGEMEVDAATSNQPGYTISVTSKDSLPILPDATIFYDGDVGTEGKFEFARNATHWSITQHGAATGTFDIQEPKGKITLLNKGKRSAENLITGFALDQAMLAGNQCMIHSAILDTPDGQSRIIIHAPSGTGKTTTTLALAAAGYKLCSDDVAIIGPRQDKRMCAWGMPRNLKVHTKTVEMLPWLKPLIDPDAWNSEGEQTIQRKKLRKLGYLADFTPKPVTAVIGLVREESATTSFVKQDRFDGLAALSAENIQFNSTGLLPGHEIRFDLYAALIADATPYQLNVSNDMASIVAAIDQIATA